MHGSPKDVMHDPHSVKDDHDTTHPRLINKSGFDRHKLHVFAERCHAMGYERLEAYRGP